MASAKNEKMKKNAQILQQKLFNQDLFKLVKFGLQSYNPQIHQKYNLYTILRFADIMLVMLEEYSKGKILTIQTHKKRRVKKSRQDLEEDNFGEGDPMELLSEEEEDEEVFQQKKFMFTVEMAQLIDYKIVENVVSLLERADDLDSGLVSAIAHFFNRIMKQCKGTFIFYQIQTMDIFESFLLAHRKDAYYMSLTNVIKKILGEFFKSCEKNPLLPFEILFTFPDKASKDRVLSNYEEQIQMPMEPESDIDNDNISGDEGEKAVWDEKEDERLKDTYDIFRYDMETCFEKLCRVFSRPEKDIKARLKKLQVFSASKEPEGPAPKQGAVIKKSLKRFVQNLLDSGTEKPTIITYLNLLKTKIEPYLDWETERIEAHEANPDQGLEEASYTIVCLNREEFDIFGLPEIKELFAAFNLAMFNGFQIIPAGRLILMSKVQKKISNCIKGLKGKKKSSKTKAPKEENKEEARDENLHPNSDMPMVEA